MLAFARSIKSRCTGSSVCKRLYTRSAHSASRLHNNNLPRAALRSRSQPVTYVTPAFQQGHTVIRRRLINAPPIPTTIHKRWLFIRTADTPNPDSMKFLPGREVMPSGTADFPSAMSATTSPLAKRLFRIEGVRRVFIGPDFITVTKDENMEWDILKTLIFSELMEFFQSGDPVISDAPPPSDTQILPEDSEVVAMIKELIETRIRPSVQDDGGDVLYLGFIDGVVFVQLQGACSGCSSSSITLKNGIERMLQHWIPEVMGVAAVDSLEEFQKIVADKSSTDAADATAAATQK